MTSLSVDPRPVGPDGLAFCPSDRIPSELDFRNVGGGGNHINPVRSEEQAHLVQFKGKTPGLIKRPIFLSFLDNNFTQLCILWV